MLGNCYDNWCLAQIARALNKTDDYKKFMQMSYTYRNVYNAETGFFHPRNKDGKFIEPFDYRYSGGQGHVAIMVKTTVGSIVGMCSTIRRI